MRWLINGRTKNRIATVDYRNQPLEFSYVSDLVYNYCKNGMKKQNYWNKIKNGQRKDKRGGKYFFKVSTLFLMAVYLIKKILCTFNQEKSCLRLVFVCKKKVGPPKQMVLVSWLRQTLGLVPGTYSGSKKMIIRRRKIIQKTEDKKNSPATVIPRLVGVLPFSRHPDLWRCVQALHLQ